MTVVSNIEVEPGCVTIYTALPGPEAGLTKAQILEAFVREVEAHLPRIADVLLGGVMRLNGRMTTEMAMAAGAIAARLGANAVELYDPTQGSYVPVLGKGGALAMPTPVLPGMVVEIQAGGEGLFRQGARAIVLNVGRDSVNIASAASASGRGRRDTGWTARENVRPVGWESPPALR